MIYFREVLIFILVFSSISKPVIAENTLILGVHPFLSHHQLEKKFSLLASYLSHQIGVKIEVRIGRSYSEHIDFIGSDKVDIAYMGPASYVRMVNRFGNKPILGKLEVNGSTFFQGNIITRKDSGIKTLSDLKGKHIAFGNPNSTMSYIVPHYMLHSAGLISEELEEHQLLPSHDDIALAVLSGDFDAGAVKPEVYRKFKSQNLISIAQTPKISEHLFVSQSKLSKQLIQKIRKVMLNMKNSKEGLNALQAVKKNITAIVEASNHDYENLKNIIFQSNHPHY